MDFLKMHGLGNDFIVVECLSKPAPSCPNKLAEVLCDRHFSIGADGLVLILPSDRADARMRIFNPDGTEPEMCGNAIRCVAKRLFDTGVCSSDMVIETLAGCLPISVTDGRVSVDMGAPKTTGHSDMLVDGKKAEFMLVSTGNPHAVTFSAYPSDESFNHYGPLISEHPIFEGGVNVEFCKLVDKKHALVRVWERGAGPTLACGTGATASFFAGVKAGVLDKNAVMTLPGGDLSFEYLSDGHVVMTGPASLAYTGSVNNLT